MTLRAAWEEDGRREEGRKPLMFERGRPGEVSRTRCPRGREGRLKKSEEMRVRKYKGILGLWLASEKGGREKKRNLDLSKTGSPWLLLGTTQWSFPRVRVGVGHGVWGLGCAWGVGRTLGTKRTF